MRLRVQEKFLRFCVFTRTKIPVFGGSLNPKQHNGKENITKIVKTKTAQKG